jgi:hypothetical protein
LLLRRRIYKQFPLFSVYLAWSLVNDVGMQFLLRHFAGVGMRIYLASAVIDALFVFCVLSEISMSVLKPIRASLPRWTIFAVAGLIASVCVIVWPFCKTLEEPQHHIFQLVVQMQLSTAVVRVLFFLALTALSQLLSLGWRDRELQIATGFGIYCLFSLLAALLHRSLPGGSSQFHHLDEVVMSSYICAMTYWVVSFAQKEPERREFTPQMHNFLLALAGNARSTRVAMSHSSVSKPDRHLPR